MAKKPSYTSKTKARSSDETEDRVKYVVEAFDRSWTYAQTNYHSRWERAWKLYNNRRVKIGYEGVSNVFVPITFSTIETMVSALAGSKPSFDYLPPRTNVDLDTAPLNALVDSYWDRDQWNIKVQSWVRSSLIFGTGVVYLYWDVDHPVIVNLPIRDFFFDPSAVSLEGCGSGFYAGRRYLTTLEELKSFEIVDADPESKTYGQMVKKYKNLDAIPESSGHDGEQTDKEQKDLFYGSTAPDPKKTQIEVLELWTDDKVCSIANRSVLIEEAENPYLVQARENGDENAKGIIPFAVQRNYVDESLFLGRGEVDIIADLQEDLNDFTNQKRDFFSYILNPMWTLDPSKQDMIDQIQAVPGAVFPLNPSDLMPVTMPSFPTQAFGEENAIENRIREATAVDQIVKGVGADTKTTATEINAQVAQAGQRIGMKITQLENEGFHRLARIVLQMVQLYVQQPVPVKTKGKDGTQWPLFDPSQYADVDDVMVQLQSTIDAKRADDVGMYKEMYLALAADPAINQQELKKILLPKIYDLDPDEVQRLLTPDATMAAPGDELLPPELGADAGLPLPDELEGLPEELPV